MFLKISQYSQENTCVETLFNKVADLADSTQVLSCEYCEIFINTYIEEHLRMTASDNIISDKFRYLHALL